MWSKAYFVLPILLSACSAQTNELNNAEKTTENTYVWTMYLKSMNEDKTHYIATFDSLGKSKNYAVADSMNQSECTRASKLMSQETGRDFYCNRGVSASKGEF